MMQMRVLEVIERGTRVTATYVLRMWRRIIMKICRGMRYATTLYE